jgi:predicted O-methyltransferase YrrM
MLSPRLAASPAEEPEEKVPAPVPKLRQSVETLSAVLRNLILGGNLAALPLLRNPRALLNYTAESRFLLHALQGRRGVSERNVVEVLNGSQQLDVTLANLAGETWLRAPASYAADIVSLCLICRTLRPLVVFEIGTLNGYTALHFALNTPDDAVIYTLDLPPEETAPPALHTTVMDDAHIRAGTGARRRLFDDTAAGDKVVPLFGDSARFDFSPYHGRVDLFFVDGAHSYDYVASDTRNALACVRPGGVIAWHDFGRSGVNGVSRLVAEVARTREVHAVPGGSVAYTVV